MRSRCWLAFGAALTLPMGIQAADPVQIQVNPVQIQVQPFGRAGGPLLTPEAVDKLKLSAEQKEKYAKIDEEYKDKQKAAGEKLKEAIQGQDRAKILEAYQNQRTEAEKLRNDSLKKVEALLGDEQKKTFEEVKKEQPKPAIRLPGAAPGGGQVLPPVIQERLKLSDEQKKKVDDLQKELEAKILGVLTEEQRKQYDELKKQSTNRIGAIQLIVP